MALSRFAAAAAVLAMARAAQHFEEVADDECSAEVGDDACALSALQRAGRKLGTAAEQAVNFSSPHHRLVIVNGCPSHPMWIAHIVTNRVGPDPQDIKLAPGQSHRFATAQGSQALIATRYWPKLGCDESGNHCSIGDSGGPGEGCVLRAPGQPDDYSHCAPPADSKFEATFAPPGSPTRDTVDMSLVDGYSVPFKVDVNGDCMREQRPFTGMDCSGLSLGKCPETEILDGRPYSLEAINPRTGKVAVCYSPCMKLTDDKWGHPVGGPNHPRAAPYCCAGAYGTPLACKSGPIMHTKYLSAVHEACPPAYGFAYDDLSATITCTSNTEYTVTFLCPDVPL